MAQIRLKHYLLLPCKIFESERKPFVCKVLSLAADMNDFH